MSLRARISRLEGVMARRGVCPLCRGLGRPAFTVEWDPDGPVPPVMPEPWERHDPPEPQGCPRCGEVALTVIRIRWEEDRSPGAGAPEGEAVRS